MSKELNIFLNLLRVGLIVLFIAFVFTVIYNNV